MPNNKKNGLKPMDFRHEFSWRVFRIMSEFIEGFQFLGDIKHEVSIFGSTRFTSANPHYKDARKLAQRLGSAGFTIITGGGPGIMEAANRGAYDAGAGSVGLNIQLKSGQRINRYVKDGIAFNYFFVRKVMLSISSQAYVFFPGGFGTLDEFFEIVMLIQTKKMRPIPVILFGKDYWQGLLDWIKKDVYEKHRAIGPKDMTIYTIVDSIDEAFNIISKTKERPYG